MVSYQPDRADLIVRGLAIGGYAGLVSGLAAAAGARLAMRTFALAIDQPPSFTFEGTMVIVMFGLIVGPAVAVGYVAIRRLLPGPWPVRGLAYGAILAAFVAFAFGNGPVDEALADPGLGTRLFAGVAVVLGLVIAGATSWFDGRVAIPRSAPSRSTALGALVGGMGLLIGGSLILSVVSAALG